VEALRRTLPRQVEHELRRDKTPGSKDFGDRAHYGRMVIEKSMPIRELKRV